MHLRIHIVDTDETAKAVRIERKLNTSDGPFGISSESTEKAKCSQGLRVRLRLRFLWKEPSLATKIAENV